MASENIIDKLDIWIENAVPYQADWKGLVEIFLITVREVVPPVLSSRTEDRVERKIRD